jgi:ATP-dependent exoDNAse (exonuclease V) beta subunit
MDVTTWNSIAPDKELDLPPLYQPLIPFLLVSESHDEPDESHPWRATGNSTHIPPGVIGQLVHKAIEVWLFPEDARLIPLLETTVLNAGLSSAEQRVEAIRRTMELLGRLRAHPLWEEINSADEQHHEVPYSRMIGERSETGYIDLLLRKGSGWQVIDFKTDIIRNDAIREKSMIQYKVQMLRYENAIEMLLGQKPQVRVCFLDDNESINLVPVD